MNLTDSSWEVQGASEELSVIPQEGLAAPAKVAAAESLRQSERVRKEVNILLIGSDAQGRAFMEETKTVVLSRHGAAIVSMRKLAAEQELVMVQSDCNEEAEIRVVGQIGVEGEPHTYGVAFLDPNLDFWRIEFSASMEAEPAECRRVLECGICGRRELTDLAVVESDVYASQDRMLRHCKRCCCSTPWKISSGEIPDAAPKPSAVPVPAEQPSFKNRRQHVRAKANFGALVRTQGSENMVVCENVSRGGLCFRSAHRYSGKANIEVAAPYSSGAPCILVPAQIVYVEELPNERVFRYGVQYLPLTKKVA